MKKIVINGDYLAFKTFAGVNRFATELLAELDNLVHGENIILLTPEYVQETPQYHNIKVVKLGNQKILKWKNTVLPLYIKRNEALLVDLTQAFPFGVRAITCVHDCIPEVVASAYTGFKGKYIRKPLKLLQRFFAIKNSLKVLTVSNFSQNDIIRLYHINAEKVVVVYNAWQHILNVTADDDILREYNQLKNKQYYFSLGSRVEHKNLQWIIAAAVQNPSEVFVVSGENSYNQNFTNKKFPCNIIFTGYISDGQIKSLMANCKAFILPSFYEGFGIPPLEALSQGAQIIVSKSACLPEIYEDSAHYIDPYDYECIDLDKILGSQVGNPNRILEKYSWRKSAEVLYRQILELK